MWLRYHVASSARAAKLGNSSRSMAPVPSSSDAVGSWSNTTMTIGGASSPRPAVAAATASRSAAPAARSRWLLTGDSHRNWTRYTTAPMLAHRRKLAVTPRVRRRHRSRPTATPPAAPTASAGSAHVRPPVGSCAARHTPRPAHTVTSPRWVACRARGPRAPLAAPTATATSAGTSVTARPKATMSRRDAPRPTKTSGVSPKALRIARAKAKLVSATSSSASRTSFLTRDMDQAPPQRGSAGCGTRHDPGSAADGDSTRRRPPATVGGAVVGGRARRAVGPVRSGRAARPSSAPRPAPRPRRRCARG